MRHITEADGKCLDTNRPLWHNAPMRGRPRQPYLRVDFKISLPAALAAEIDLMFEDPLTRRPKYGARARLVESLLRNWLDAQRGHLPSVHVPSLEELRDA